MKTVKTIPDPAHSLQPYLNIKNADKAIDFYKKVFGAEEIGRMSMYGKVGHAELKIGQCTFMVAEEMAEWGNKSPETLGGSPVSFCLYVEDVDAVFKKAIDAGAKVENGMEPKDQFYGDRSGNIIDPFGHKWVISTHIEDVSFEEMQKRADKMAEK